MLGLTRLQTRFVLLVLAAAMLFACLASGAAYWLAFDRATADSEQVIRRLCLTVNKTAAIAAYVGNQDVAEDVVNGLLNNEIVFSARVDAGSRMSVEHGKQSGDGAASPSAITVVCPLFSPFNIREQVGDLVIVPNAVAVAENARGEALRQVVILVAQVAVISLLLVVVVGAYLSRPIAELATRLRSMTPGTAERLPVLARHEDDEIGVLVDSSNELLSATEEAFRLERKLRAEVEAMEQQYRRIFDTTSAGIFVVNGDGHLINANPTVMTITGRASEDYATFEGDSFFNQIFADPAQVWALVHQAARQGQTIAEDLEVLAHGGGASRWVHCLISVQSEERRIRLVEGVMYDITDRKRKESEVLHLAEHDALTGLKNRRSCELFIEQTLSRLAGTQRRMAVMLIDLDGFKPINDQYGHAAGDEVLMAIALRLRNVVRKSSDMAGRLGGDEFVVIMGECGEDASAASRVAAELLRVLSQPIALAGGMTVQVGASIGISFYPEDGTSCASLMLAADEAMYNVKRSGKNAFAFAPRSGHMPG